MNKFFKGIGRIISWVGKPPKNEKQIIEHLVEGGKTNLYDENNSEFEIESRMILYRVTEDKIIL